MPYDARGVISKIQTCPLEELYLITPEYLVPYLNYVKKHRRVFRTAYEHASVLGLNETYHALNRHVFTPILERFHILPSEQKYMMPFYLNGLMGIINEWLKEDCEDAVEHVISVMQRCIARRAQ